MSVTDLILHPVRLRIVQALAGTSMTPLELKDRLGDVAQATLYRHLNTLADAGVVEVVGERPVRGGTERTYRLVEGAASLTATDLEDADADDHLRYFVTFAAALISEFASYLSGGSFDLEGDRVGYRQAPLWLTDDEFDEMASEMSRIMEPRLTNEPGSGRRLRLWTTVVMPGPGRPPTSE